jgi:hypothetical protein
VSEMGSTPYRSLMPSLALLFELADLAATGFEGFDGSDVGRSSAAPLVSLHNTARSMEWCIYLESQAERIYSSAGSPTQRAAFKLATKMKSRSIGSTGVFTCREVELKDWSGLKSPDEVQQAAAYLQKMDWIRDATKAPGPRGGRPSVIYEINPRIWAEGRMSA